ncbi:MAG TPA: F0F1 ATP synthase subunit beta, partial [Candidatus Acetothermia bacterium]|nr:F0F1 ATP synthase subunit beta [Candidatus Acetothermia bacterium]
MTENAHTGKGRILTIRGPVVDVQFPPGQLPPLRQALRIVRDDGDLVLEVAQHLGDSAVRAIAMDSTDGLKRADEVIDTGGPITVPVGPETLGRMFDLTGQPIDEQPPPGATNRYPIHRESPPLADLAVEDEILETGIKVLDLIAPIPKGGKVGLFGGAG